MKNKDTAERKQKRQVMGSQSVEKKLDRRRLRFGLRSLLGLFVLVSIPLLVLNRYQNHSARTQRFIDNAEQFSFSFAPYFNRAEGADEFLLTGNWRWNEKYDPVTSGPQWAKKWTGEYAFDEIEGINIRNFKGESLSSCLDFSDVAGVKRILMAGAPNLVSLAGIEHLSDLEMLVIIDAPNLNSIAGIQHSQKLTRLILQNCSQLSDVDEVGSLTKLEALSLDGSMPTDLHFLQNLTELKFLHFTSAQSTRDLSDLKNLSALRWLEISNCMSLDDAKGLEHLKSLEFLKIRNCPQVTNFAAATLQTPLKDLTLTRLTSAQARSLSGLSGHPTLNKIWIGTPDEFGWVDEPRSTLPVPGFSDLPNLVELTIRSDAKDQFECLSEMPKLARVVIFETAAETLPKLEAVPALKQITLEKCSAITSLEGLNNVPSLEKLTCLGCPKLEDISAIEDHPNLNDLWLHKIALASHKPKGQRLESLENLSSLTKLCISKVPLDDLDLRSLFKLKKLKYLWISSNLGLTSTAGDRLKRQLPDCKVEFSVFDIYTDGDEF